MAHRPCNTCASMAPLPSGLTHYCAKVLTFVLPAEIAVDCPWWEAKTEVEGELIGDLELNTLVCGDCVVLNGSANGVGSCSVFGPRHVRARACRRFFPKTELSKNLYGKA